MKNIISALQESISVPDGVFFESKDGTNIHITSEDACTLVSVHDILTKDNQVKMRSLLEESEQEYTKVLDFCNKQFNEQG